MRDGIELSCDVWLPGASGAYPVILIRTPYVKTSSMVDFPKLARFFADKGYAVAVQDVRGRGDSDGEFGFLFQEANDGYDSVEWLAAQPWCNGRVGMMGFSYMGAVQWLAAREQPPHLACIASTAAVGDYLDELPYIGGAFKQHWALFYCNFVSGKIEQSSLDDDEWARVFDHRPLITADEAMGRRMPHYREWLEHPTFDGYWRRILLTAHDFRNIGIPALHITGWFDADQPGAMYYWRGMTEYSVAARQQYLIVGPWDHRQTFNGGEARYGEMEFTGDSVIDPYRVHLDFFDKHLKAAAEDFDSARVRLYVTGRNEWREFDDYPPPDASVRRLYLSSAGRANSLLGNGRLIDVVPNSEAPDQYVFDPINPVPLIFGVPSKKYAVDRRPLERRDDVLVYTGEVLSSPVEVIGRVGVELYAASDARDTDFTASIIDVYPDERAVVLGARVVGIIRARYRHGLDTTELLTPGKVERYHIDLGHIGHSFEPGHRIRLEISSSAAPSFNPNQNTGNPIATDTEWRSAQQTIHHDERYPSALVLTVVGR